MLLSNVLPNNDWLRKTHEEVTANLSRDSLSQHAYRACITVNGSPIAIERYLGGGNFGGVYLSKDGRAIKVHHEGHYYWDQSLLAKARELGIVTPVVYELDPYHAIVVMEYIRGLKFREIKKAVDALTASSETPPEEHEKIMEEFERIRARFEQILSVLFNSGLGFYNMSDNLLYDIDRNRWVLVDPT